MSTMLNDPRLGAADPQAGSALDQARRRLARADLGQIPIIIGLLVIWGVFQVANQNFLTPGNLTNLLLQIIAMGTISIGITLVLLLGEIDLSAGYVSGLCAAIMAVQNVKNGMPGPVAVLLGLLAGLAIGLFQGFWITKLRVPAFIVTLAGFLGWQGVLLQVLGNTGTVNLRDPFITGLAGSFFGDQFTIAGLPIGKNFGWVVAILCIAALVVSFLVSQRQRRAAGLLVESPTFSYVRLGIIALAILIAMAVFNADRGLPVAVVIFIGLIVVFDWLIRRTTWGRYVFAVGGNAEAARRASIDVDWIRISIFGLCSLLAAAGGILGGSRLLAVNQSSGSGDLLLNSIAAAVIGGTSLFGGRGTVWGALLGALVIGTISNGMDLLALGAPVKFMITGLVLLLAVTLDAVARRRRETRGR